MKQFLPAEAKFQDFVAETEGDPWMLLFCSMDFKSDDLSCEGLSCVGNVSECFLVKDLIKTQ